HPQRQRLHLEDGLRLARAVDEAARQLQHLRDPAPVLRLAVDLDLEAHAAAIVSVRGRTVRWARSPSAADFPFPSARGAASPFGELLVPGPRAARRHGPVT